MADKKHKGHGVFIGLLFIALGGLWVLHNLDVIDFHFATWWPLILIAVGLLTLYSSRRYTDPGGWILIGVGIAFLLITNGVFEWDQIWDFWPVILIFIGLSILLGHRGHRAPAQESDNGDLVGSAIFSEINRRIGSKDFKGGRMSTVFGSIKIDLLDAELNPEGAVMDISTVFGSCKIIVPPDWPIQVQTSMVMGSINNRSRNAEVSDGLRLILRGSSVFGSIDIKN